MKRTLLAAFAAFAIVLTACAPLPVGTGTPAFAQGLVAFDACEDYLAHVKAEAKRIVTPYGLNNGYYGPVWFEGDVALREFAAADGGTTTTPAGGLRDAVAGVDYSTTYTGAAGDTIAATVTALDTMLANATDPGGASRRIGFAAMGDDGAIYIEGVDANFDLVNGIDDAACGVGGCGLFQKS